MLTIQGEPVRVSASIIYVYFAYTSEFMDTKAKILRSDLLLLIGAVIWGSTFVAQRYGSQHVGTFTFNAVRFALGSIFLVPIFLLTARRKARSEEQPTGKHFIFGCCMAGVTLFLAACTQQAGIAYTTAGKAGFITGLYMVIVPIMGFFWRQKVGFGTLFGMILATVGLYLLCISESFSIGKGDLLVLISAIFWAGHVQIIGWLSVRFDPIRVALFQYVVCAVLSAVGAVLTEEIVIANIRSAIVPIMYAGFLSTGIAFTLQVIAQRDSLPAHAAIMMSMEAVFAALGGYLILSEVMTFRDMIGCGFILTGMLMSQLCVRKIIQNNGGCGSCPAP